MALSCRCCKTAISSDSETTTPDRAFDGAQIVPGRPRSLRDDCSSGRGRSSPGTRDSNIVTNSSRRSPLNFTRTSLGNSSLCAWHSESNKERISCFAELLLCLPGKSIKSAEKTSDPVNYSYFMCRPIKAGSPIIETRGSSFAFLALPTTLRRRLLVNMTTVSCVLKECRWFEWRFTGFFFPWPAGQPATVARLPRPASF